MVHANGNAKADIAYINNEPYEIKEGETIISFIEEILEKMLCLLYVMLPTWNHLVPAGYAVWMLH